MTRALPQRVRLRCEDVRVAPQAIGGQADSQPYELRRDSQVEALIESAGDDKAAAIRAWFQIVKPRLLGTHGRFLIPGQLQQFLGLPVRQVYVLDDAVYRIDPDTDGFGRVTVQLV